MPQPGPHRRRRVVELDGRGLLAQVRLHHATEPVTGSDQQREPFRQDLRDPKQAAAVFGDPGIVVAVSGVRHENEGFTLVRRGADRVAARPGLVVHDRAGQDRLAVVRFYETDGSRQRPNLQPAGGSTGGPVPGGGLGGGA